LSLIDFELDPFIANLYFLMRGLYYTFTHDVTISGLDGRIIKYDPDRHPGKYDRQGLYLGRLDNIIASLMIFEGDLKNTRIMSYLDFETYFFSSTNEKYVREPLSEAEDLFYDFNAKTRPVLWRILLAQAYIYYVLITAISARHTDSTDVRIRIRPITGGVRKRFEIDRSHIVNEAQFKAVDDYFTTLKERGEKIGEFW
jgi:hypothetical protein